MGIEAYTVTFLPEGVDIYIAEEKNSNGQVINIVGSQHHSKVEFVVFRDWLRRQPYVVEEYPRWADSFVIEQGVLVSTEVCGRWLKTFTLGGCFTWYEEGIKICYSLAREFHANVLPIRMYPNLWIDKCINFPEEDVFYDIVGQSHKERFENFREHYEAKRYKILPNEFWKERSLHPFQIGYWKRKFSQITGSRGSRTGFR